MRAVLLCPGPSLASAPLAEFAGESLLIGVNRAAAAVPCDVWAAGDYPLIRKSRCEVLGLPELLTAAATAKRLAESLCPWPRPVIEFEECYRFCPPRLHWELFTATAALVYAAYRGATSIDVWGADWQGEADFDGERAGLNRSPDRWRLEQRNWDNLLVPWLDDRGVTVHRHAKDDKATR